MLRHEGTATEWDGESGILDMDTGGAGSSPAGMQRSEVERLVSVRPAFWVCILCLFHVKLPPA